MSVLLFAVGNLLLDSYVDPLSIFSLSILGRSSLHCLSTFRAQAL